MGLRSLLKCKLKTDQLEVQQAQWRSTHWSRPAEAGASLHWAERRGVGMAMHSPASVAPVAPFTLPGCITAWRWFVRRCAWATRPPLPSSRLLGKQERPINTPCLRQQQGGLPRLSAGGRRSAAPGHSAAPLGAAKS